MKYVNIDNFKDLFFNLAYLKTTGKFQNNEGEFIPNIFTYLKTFEQYTPIRINSSWWKNLQIQKEQITRNRQFKKMTDQEKKEYKDNYFKSLGLDI